MYPATASAPTLQNEIKQWDDNAVSPTIIYPRVSVVQQIPKTYPQEKGANILLGQQIASTKGIVGPEWECLYQLGMRESGWNHLAKNKTSGAYGIPQSLPASKLDTYGDRHDPAVQIRWFIDYVFARYGTSCKALSFQVAHNWY